MLKDFTSALRPAIVMTILFAVLLCGVYPAIVTGIGQAAFPAQAGGSLIRDGRGQVIGSELIGQAFAVPGYFHGRPSAAGKGYDPTASSGSNLGPTSQALLDRVKGDLKANGPVPADLVTTSGSGLDPHISPEGARAQIARVAAARHIAPTVLQRLVDAQVEGPIAGAIGEPRVNVLLLNQALDRVAKRS